MSLDLTPVTNSQLLADQTCAICRDDFEVQNGQIVNNVVQTKCHHLFHETCAAGLITFNITRCPLCRRDIKKADNNDFPILFTVGFIAIIIGLNALCYIYDDKEPICCWESMYEEWHSSICKCVYR